MNYLDREYEWTKKSVCKAIFLVKCILSLIIGIVLGIIGIQGYIGFSIFFGIIISISCLFVVYYSLDELDPEVTYGNAINEGLGVSLSIFLLSWILIFSLFHNGF